MNRVFSAFGEVIKRVGFQKKSPRLYFIENQDAFCFIHLECPSNIIYLDFGILPVYLPPIGFYMNYGWRLNNRYSQLRSITKNTSDDGIREYCIKLEIIVKDELMPLIRTLSTAEEIMKFFEGDYYLAAYSELYLQHYSEAKELAKQYLLSLHQTNYTQRIKEERQKEMERIISYSFEDKEYLEKVFADWRVKNSNHFIGFKS